MATIDSNPTFNCLVKSSSSWPIFKKQVKANQETSQWHWNWRQNTKWSFREVAFVGIRWCHWRVSSNVSLKSSAKRFTEEVAKASSVNSKHLSTFWASLENLSKMANKIENNCSNPILIFYKNTHIGLQFIILVLMYT